MSMTENEAIERMKYRIATAKEAFGIGADGKAFDDMEKAIQALEEVQAYRAIGTVEELKAIKQWKPDIIESFSKYDVSGVDELMKKFKELTEKAEPKKPIGISLTHEGRVGNCPCCNKLVAEHNDNKFCSCNQRLDWNERCRMKEIFDWIREEMYSETFGFMDELRIFWKNAENIIDEAEAKWKDDCCEWKMSRTRLRKFDEYMWVTSCNNGNEIFGIPHWIVKNYNVCPYCGKPIKIAEVE